MLAHSIACQCGKCLSKRATPHVASRTIRTRAGILSLVSISMIGGYWRVNYSYTGRLRRAGIIGGQMFLREWNKRIREYRG